MEGWYDKQNYWLTKHEMIKNWIWIKRCYQLGLTKRSKINQDILVD